MMSAGDLEQGVGHDASGQAAVPEELSDVVKTARDEVYVRSLYYENVGPVPKLSSSEIEMLDLTNLGEVIIKHASDGRGGLIVPEGDSKFLEELGEMLIPDSMFIDPN